MNRRIFLSGIVASLGLSGCVEGGSGRGANNSESPIQNRIFEIIDPSQLNEDTENPVNVEESPTIRYDSSHLQVTITGTLKTGGTCKTAMLESAKYNPDTDSLKVTVADIEKDDAGDHCGAVAGTKSYEVIVEFRQNLPRSVTAVERDVQGNMERTTVETR